MSTQVKLLAEAGGHNIGDIITVTDGSAAHLIESEYAEPTETKARRGRPKGSPDADTSPLGGTPDAEDEQTAG